VARQLRGGFNDDDNSRALSAQFSVGFGFRGRRLRGCRRSWFAVEAPEPSPAAAFLEKLALSGRYVQVQTPTRALGTVVCNVPISRDGLFRAFFAGVGEPLVR
jgi:hypothetical protein